MLLPNVTLSEAKRLLRGWTCATLKTVPRSIRYHFRQHGADVGAGDVWQYLRKADGWRGRLRGAQRTALNGGKVRYTRNNRFLILNALGKIVSFGAERPNYE